MSGRPPRTHHLPRFALESGAVLTDVVQAYHLDGRLNAERDNLVIVFHALTGSADPLHWWKGVVGPGLAIDTDRYAVLCANLLGSCYGTTYAEDLPEAPVPEITPRDQVRLIRALVAELHVESVALAVGASLGGMVALEWAASYPGLTRATLVVAAPAAHPAAAIGWNHIQRVAIQQGGEQGLELARMVAMMTYRTAGEFQSRFGRSLRGPAYEVEHYLSHQGGKLRQRFSARSYLSLLGAMDAHDVGRGRGGIDAALRRLQGRVTGVGIPGDRLYAAEEVREWTRVAGAEYREIHSVHGHDAFLIETEQVGKIVTEALEGASATASPWT